MRLNVCSSECASVVRVAVGAIAPVVGVVDVAPMFILCSSSVSVAVLFWL